MSIELNELDHLSLLEPRLPRDTRFVNALPSGLVFTEAAIASLRAELIERGLGDWEIFQTDSDFWSICRHAAPGATWRPLPALTGGEPMQKLDSYANGKLWHTAAGVLAVDGFDAVLARWMLHDPSSGYNRSLRLVAVPSIDAFDRLLQHVRECEAREATATWQILNGGCGDDIVESPPRSPVDAASLILDEAILQRIEREAVGFFSEPVAAMYQKLRVPLRRGVLLYGPPGNGKTSTIRYLGGRLPNVAALVLRPGDGFGTDQLMSIIAQWKAQAPAMLVIEDLNWLLARIDLSQFLNALDGIETPDVKGLLLVASTNHPDKLDPALSNRPGRFDVLIEVPLPDSQLRRRYWVHQLPEIDEALVEQLVHGSDGLSFAHLGEIIRVAGLTVIAEGRAERTSDDLLNALRVVADANASANRGFAGAAAAFGLQACVRR